MIFGIYEDRAGYFCRFYQSPEEIPGSVINARLVTMCAAPTNNLPLKTVADLFYNLRSGDIEESALLRRLGKLVN